MLIPVHGQVFDVGSAKKRSKRAGILELTGALYVPELKATLISPKQMFREQKIRSYFNDELCFVLPNGTVIHFEETHRNYRLPFASTNRDVEIFVSAAKIAPPITADLIHQRLGHFSWCSLSPPVGLGGSILETTDCL